MRAFLGAASVEIQVRFAGDLLHTTELNVAQAGRCYEVGEATTAQLPLPLPPFALLRVGDDRLELCVPDSMWACLPGGDRELAAHETVVVRWQAVEIAIVPSLPSRAHSWRGRRSWPVELLSSTAASVIGLLTLFPAALLLLAMAGSSSSSIDRSSGPTRIVYTWRAPPDSAAEPEPATAPKVAARERKTTPVAKTESATPQPRRAQAAAAASQAAHADSAPALRDSERGDADAPSHDHDSGFAGSAAADRATADRQQHADRAQANAREAAARAGLIGVLQGRVQIGASATANEADAPNDVVFAVVQKDAGRGARATSGGAPGGGGSSGSPAGGGSSSGASSTGGGSTSALSDDPFQETTTSNAFDVGGLELVGSGVSGGGGGEGTIGLGDLGTIGHGSGGGTGCGYGRGEGGLGGLTMHAPDVVPGTAQVRGALDKEMIRRVIRRHLNEVRFCYESALQNSPELTGRVLIDFVIQPDGSVAASSAQESTFADPAIGECTARAFSRWQFPSARGGGVTEVHYPFDFVPAGS